MTQTQNEPILSEEYIQDSFHSYLKSSLAQAKAERLLDVDLLSSAEGDLMITGPALCLYFAALRCTTNPPSVPLPRTTSTKSSSGSNSSSNLPHDLSPSNCPPAFTSFLLVWASTVPLIQGLIPEHQHDLARIICGLPPLSSPINMAVGGIAADLRAVAIEISQRRSFQERYGGDLQAVLDAGSGDNASSRKKASFVPPPSYEEFGSDATSPTRSSIDSPHPGLRRVDQNLPPLPPRRLSPASTHYRSSSTSSCSTLTPSMSTKTRKTPSPTSLSPLEFIRETLYAALADVLSSSSSLLALLSSDPPRAYFASVSFAILQVATTCVSFHGDEDVCVKGVLGRTLTSAECPKELKPFMLELISIALAAKEMDDHDTKEALAAVRTGHPVPRETRMERVRNVLEGGVGHHLSRRGSRHRRSEGPGEELGELRGRRRSTQGRAVAFANRVNALSLGLTRLKAFRERQEEVFRVLAGVGSGL